MDIYHARERRRAAFDRYVTLGGDFRRIDDRVPVAADMNRLALLLSGVDDALRAQQPDLARIAADLNEIDALEADLSERMRLIQCGEERRAGERILAERARRMAALSSADILRAAEERGFRLSLDGDRIVASPRGLPSDLRAAVEVHAAAVKDLLRSRTPEVIA
jgi:hypothetical protein